MPKCHLFKLSHPGLNTHTLCPLSYPLKLSLDSWPQQPVRFWYLTSDTQSIKDTFFRFFFPYIFVFYQKNKKHWRCLHHRQESSIFCFKQFRHEQNEPHAHPTPGANSSIHSILYIPIVPVQPLYILHHYQSSINRFKIHTILFHCNYNRYPDCTYSIISHT